MNDHAGLARQLRDLARRHGASETTVALLDAARTLERLAQDNDALRRAQRITEAAYHLVQARVAEWEERYHDVARLAAAERELLTRVIWYCAPAPDEVAWRFAAQDHIWFGLRGGMGGAVLTMPQECDA